MDFQSQDPLPGSALSKVGLGEVYHASLAQRRLWFLELLQGPTAAYNVDVGLWLYGPLDLAALHRSLQEMVNRHETLRTFFRLHEGELIQVVAHNLTIPLPVADFSSLEDPYPSAYEYAKKEVGTPFDLGTGPLFRASVIHIKDQENVVLCTMHHAITDAWSMQIFTRELATLYDTFSTGKPASLPELPVQYGDYSEWQRESLATDTAQQQLAYWKTALQGAPALLQLPQDAPRPPEQSLKGSRYINSIPAEIVADVTEIATGQRATPFMMLLAAFKTLLYRYSGEPDVLVGVPIAGRSQVETEGLIGFFVDTVVLRDNLSGNPQFLELLDRVRETTLGALANTDVPFEKVVEVLQPKRDLSYNPVFQCMFSVIKSAVRSHGFGSLVAYPYVVNTSASIVDLFATFVEDSDGKWWLQIDWNTDLFRQERIHQMYEDFTALLQVVVSNPEIHLDQIALPNFSRAEVGVHSFTKKPVATVKPFDSFSKLRRREIAATSAGKTLLTGIWKEVLGLPNIGMHDNFFDIGGHSLLAARLIAKIQEATGRKIPVSAIFRAPTIESLARLIHEDSFAKPDPLLMQLQQGRNKPFFFGVAAPGVDSLGYGLLARHLGDQQTVYKLQNPGLALKQPLDPEASQNLASEYIKAMRSVQPHGPYCLGGMCDGALIAQQMILQLESEGEEVALFAIFDTWVLENSQNRTLWNVYYYMQRLRGLHDVPFDQFVRIAKRVLRRCLEPSQETEWDRTYWPGQEFQTPRFRAPILLFKRPRQPFYYKRDPQMGWGARSIGGIEIVEIECEHYEVLRQPHVQIVGERLAQRLREFQTESISSDSARKTVSNQIDIQPGMMPAEHSQLR